MLSVLVVEAPLEPLTGLLLNLSGEAGMLELHYQRTGPTHNYLSTLYRVQGDGGVEKVKVSGSSLSPAKFHRLKTGRYGALGRSCYSVRHMYCERATFTDLIELPPLPIPKTLKKSASIRFRSPLGLREGNLNESKPQFRTEPGFEMRRAAKLAVLCGPVENPVLHLDYTWWTHRMVSWSSGFTCGKKGTP